MTKIYALFNQSGGVAKTTMTMNLGHLIGERHREGKQRYRVLVVDMDPQASLTAFSGLDPYALEASIYNALIDKSAPKILKYLDSYDIIPANLKLSLADMQLSTAVRREDRLKRVLSKVQSDYDVILIDCPPGLSLLSVMSMVAANHLIIPIQTEFKSVQATINLLKTTYEIVQDGNPELIVAGVIPTMYDGRLTQAKQALKSINATFERLKQNKTFKEAVVFDPIPRRTAIADAVANKQPLAVFDPKHPALEPMNSIVDHILGET